MICKSQYELCNTPTLHGQQWWRAYRLDASVSLLKIAVFPHPSLPRKMVKAFKWLISFIILKFMSRISYDTREIFNFTEKYRPFWIFHLLRTHEKFSFPNQSELTSKILFTFHWKTVSKSIRRQKGSSGESRRKFHLCSSNSAEPFSSRLLIICWINHSIWQLIVHLQLSSWER